MRKSNFRLIVLWAGAALIAQPADAKPRRQPRPHSSVKPPAPAVTATAKAVSTTSAALDLNTAGKPDLSPVPVLSSEAKSAILNFRAFQTYSDATDFATKVCSRVAVDFGATDIKINGVVSTGFKCLVPASGLYQANGASHAYPLAPEITGTSTAPPAPPG